MNHKRNGPVRVVFYVSRISIRLRSIVIGRELSVSGEKKSNPPEGTRVAQFVDDTLLRRYSHLPKGIRWGTYQTYKKNVAGILWDGKNNVVHWDLQESIYDWPNVVVMDDVNRGSVAKWSRQENHNL